MSYSNVPIGASNPGLIIIMVDQSYSMTDPYGTGQKKDIAASAVNRVIHEVGLACQSGHITKDRCYLAVIGYGEKVEALVNGHISEIVENPKELKKIVKKQLDEAGGLIEVPEEMPIWINPEANNGTPMHQAFDAAYQIAEEWISNNPDNFPPVIINITDGEPNHPDETKDAANRLMGLSTSDGNTLILNAHISNAAAGEISLPNNDAGLYDQYAKFLFDISSVLPETLFQAAKNAGFSPQPDARGFVFNAKAETMISLLNFGSLGAMR